MATAIAVSASVGCATGGHIALPVPTKELPGLRRDIDGRTFDVEHVAVSSTENGRTVEVLQTTTGEVRIDRAGRHLLIWREDGREVPISLLQTRRISDTKTLYLTGVGAVAGLVAAFVYVVSSPGYSHECETCNLSAVVIMPLLGTLFGTGIGSYLSSDWTFAPPARGR
ncbi:MAG TPA: hypothetical protein VGF45_23090 [Polyangia bacterium]